MEAVGAFESLYTRDIITADPHERPVVTRALRARRAAGGVVSPTGARFALRGAVLTPDGVLEGGYVLVEDGRISALTAAPPPTGTRCIETNGVILPGLIDLHGHPEFNIFAAWEPPEQYKNRYQWRGSDVYHALIREPMDKLLLELRQEGTAPGPQVLGRYAELRALIGGVTAIQGSTSADPGESLVRNVDRRIFGAHRARSVVDPLKKTGADLEKLRAELATGAVNALYVHIAEGTDEASRRELPQLVEKGLLTPATILIHGTALDQPQLAQIREVGAKMVWSPQSNLRLYGQTLDARAALELGVPLGLGADWLPSGSSCLLAELKVARAVLRRQGLDLEPRRLVQMVTSDAADIAGLGEHLGRLLPGRPADLLVLERRHQDPYLNVVEAEPSWVELVTIGGDCLYGRPEWLAQLAPPGATGPAPEPEPVLAWGKPMGLDIAPLWEGAPAGPWLGGLRALILRHYANLGPIFA